MEETIEATAGCPTKKLGGIDKCRGTPTMKAGKLAQKHGRETPEMGGSNIEQPWTFPEKITCKCSVILLKPTPQGQKRG